MRPHYPPAVIEREQACPHCGKHVGNRGIGFLEYNMFLFRHYRNEILRPLGYYKLKKIIIDDWERKTHDPIFDQE